MKCLAPCCLCVTLAWLAISFAPAFASAVEGAEDATAEGQRAFERSGTMPWYDAETDALKPMHFRARPDWGWNPRFPSFSLRWVAWTLLTVLLVALAVLIYFYVRTLSVPASEEQHTAGVVLAADHVEALPFMAQRSQGDLLGEARRHYEQGNYSEAIIYLFSYELVQLDKFSLVRLARGKTNRQYLREAARTQGVKGVLERTMLTFEDVFFGQRPLDRASFEACWSELGEFETCIARTAP